MSAIRFNLIAVGVFMLTFAGMYLVNSAGPIRLVAMKAEAIKAEPAKADSTKTETMSIEAIKPDARLPVFQQSANAGARDNRESSKIVQSAADKERDKLRIDLLKASIGYNIAPCDETMKKNLVVALTNYTNAWSALAHCKAGIDGCPSRPDDRIDAASAAFNSAADAMVQKALRQALDQGGIAKADFPRNVRNTAFMWTGLPLREPDAACIQSRQAEARR